MRPGKKRRRSGENGSYWISYSDMMAGMLFTFALILFMAVYQLVDLQQKMGESKSVIMDGRDIGTVVLPDAEVKIYLDAGVEERARRRVGELEAKGETADFEEIKKMIIQRDYNDMNREHSPLKKADDAVVLDSTSMTVEEVQQAILDIVAERV